MSSGTLWWSFTRSGCVPLRLIHALPGFVRVAHGLTPSWSPSRRRWTSWASRHWWWHQRHLELLKVESDYGLKHRLSFQQITHPVGVQPFDTLRHVNLEVEPRLDLKGRHSLGLLCPRFERILELEG